MEIKVILEKQEEGGYTAYVPSLPGCISQGENKEEALKNIKEAIELYLEEDILNVQLQERGYWKSVELPRQLPRMKIRSL